MQSELSYDPNKLRILAPAIWLRMHHLPPMGWMSDFKAYKMVPDPILFPQLRKIWELVLQGIPIDRVRVIANEEMKIRTPIRGRLGGKPIQRCAFYKMLADPFYAGTVRFRDEFVRGLHEPMVSIEEFMKVQGLLQNRRRNRG